MPTLRLVAKIDGSLKDMLNTRADEIGDALRAAVENAATSLQTELRDQVRSAGLGDGLASAWQLTVFPQGKRSSWRPAGLVYSKATRLHAAFNMGGTISARNAQWLVIPLPPAIELGLATDRRQNKGASNRALNRKWSNVDAAIDLFGDLRFVPIGGSGASKALLVANPARAKRGERLSNHGGRRVARAGNQKDIPLFLLVKQVTGRKLLDIDGAAERALARLRRNLSNIAPR